MALNVEPQRCMYTWWVEGFNWSNAPVVSGNENGDLKSELMNVIKNYFDNLLWILVFQNTSRFTTSKAST